MKLRSDLTRRSLLAAAFSTAGTAQVSPKEPIRLSLNENAYGPSPEVAKAIRREMGRLHRYAGRAEAQHLAEKIAAIENTPVDMVLVGEVLAVLGIHIGSRDGRGGEVIYSVPGYMGLIDSAVGAGCVGVPVSLNARFQNDLDALQSKMNDRTRAIYVVNPQNPAGTVNDREQFTNFLRKSSRKALVIVDEAYLEYTTDYRLRSAAPLVHEGADVAVFRTLDKIYGLAGLPIGYLLAPRNLVADLRKLGVGSAESLGRLNVAAALAALSDTAHVDRVRTAVLREREVWLSVLRDLKLRHTEATANFVFFDVGVPQPRFAAALLGRGIDIGRAHPPYGTWARITIGLPQDNRRAQAALADFVRANR